MDPENPVSGWDGLEAIDLWKEYPAPAGALSVLEGISFRLAPGESLAIQGPSGSGKSTLLFILGALEPPSRGEVRLGGIDPHALAEREQAKFRSRRLGFIFQDHHLLPQLTLLENVLVPALLRDRDELDFLARARDLIRRVGLGERLDHLPGELSGGERQRAAIARALLNKPEIVYCDEPTGNLDTQTGEKIHQLILDLNRETSVTFVLVTHDEELAQHAHRRLRMRDGKFEDGSGLV